MAWMAKGWVPLGGVAVEIDSEAQDQFYRETFYQAMGLPDEGAVPATVAVTL